MSAELDQIIRDSINPAAQATAPKPNLFLAPHVAANIIEMLKRVTTTGFEAYALVEAVTVLRQVAAIQPQGPGVPFVPANQAQ